jgi:hypothetical protein
MGYLFANYATARLAVELDGAENTVTIVSGGSLFPVASASNIFQAVLEDVDGNIEVVTVTNHALDANVFTVSRAQEDTFAQTFPAGSVFELRLTRDILLNFLQRTGGTMLGPIDMNGQELSNAIFVAPNISGGVLTGVTIRDSGNDPTTEITIPLGGNPQIGGSDIVTEASLGDVTNIGGIAIADIITTADLVIADLVTVTRQIDTAVNSGLAGGGDLSADLTLELDLTNLLPMSEVPAHDDQFTVYDTSDTAGKKVAAETVYGVRVRDPLLVANHTLQRVDATLLLEFDSPTDLVLTIPPNSEVPFVVGTVIPVRRRGAGALTVAPGSGVTIESPNNHTKVATRYGIILLIKRDTNIWALEGRLGA